MRDGSEPIEKPIKCYGTVVEGAALLQSHLVYFEKEPDLRAL